MSGGQRGTVVCFGVAVIYFRQELPGVGTWGWTLLLNWHWAVEELVRVAGAVSRSWVTGTLRDVDQTGIGEIGRAAGRGRG